MKKSEFLIYNVHSFENIHVSDKRREINRLNHTFECNDTTTTIIYLL